MFRCLVLLLLGISSVLAQTTGAATIVGAVSDPTGAVISGAEVTSINTGTSFVTKSMTTAEGTYYLPYLIPGAYRLTIQAAGFKQYVRDGIILRTARSKTAI